ncbi:MAG: histidine phosphatase family protein [Bacteroidota bacterium]
MYIIRHGETHYNRMGIVQGSGVDTDINSLGQQQADAFFQAYKHIPFQRIYVSSLKRTHQTVAPFAPLNIPTQIIPELNEINWGILEGQQPSEHSRKEFYAMLQRWRNGELNQAINGGETPLAMQKRQKVGLKKIESSTDNPVLICMHGRALRGFLCLLTNTPLENMDDFEHDNVCLYVLEKHDRDAHYQIKIKNNLDHLTHLR